MPLDGQPIYSTDLHASLVDAQYQIRRLCKDGIPPGATTLAVNVKARKMCDEPLPEKIVITLEFPDTYEDPPESDEFRRVKRALAPFTHERDR